MERLKEFLMEHEDMVAGCRERLPRPFKGVLDFAIEEVSSRLMTEVEAIDPWNKGKFVSDCARSFLDKGNGSPKQHARWRKELRQAEKRLARIKKRFPDIEELVVKQEQAWQATRAEILGE